MTTTRLRNLGICAHVDAGKTTLTERLLKLAGRIHRIGEVHDGNATMDFDPEERARGITIQAAATRFEWRDHAINLIDTPGHIDFGIEVERALRVLDGAVAVFCAVGGVEPQSETVWRQADRYGVPRLAFVNKMDRVGADFDRVVTEMEERLHARPAVLVAPLGAEDAFEGVLDVLGRRALRWRSDAPEDVEVEDLAEAAGGDLVAELARRRDALVEVLADLDEAVLAAWSEGAVPDDLLRAALRRATVAGRVVPVLAGSAYRSRGIQPLLDAVVDLLPAPQDRPPVVARRGDDEVTLPADPEGPLAAFAFKVTEDRYGRRGFVRVYSGTLRAGDAVVDTATGRRARVSRLLRVHADQTEELERAEAGEIVAVVGPKDLVTGHTLAAPGDDLAMEGLEVPEPVVRLALEAGAAADQGRLAVALSRLTTEDPSLVLSRDSETGQTLLGGMGELHLEVAVGKLAREYGLEVAVGRPQVAYREALVAAARATGKVKKQRGGGSGQFAVATLEVTPADRAGPVVFEAPVSGAAVPRAFHGAVEAGVRDALADGLLAGYPVVGLRVALVDGQIHEQDSNELAFREAGRLATRAALEAGGLVLLEPVMALDITAPEARTGDVLGDLSGRRGLVRGMEARGATNVVAARAPLAELFGYARALRSLTEGRASFSMSVAGFEEAPVAVQAAVVAKAGG